MNADHLNTAQGRLNFAKKWDEQIAQRRLQHDARPAPKIVVAQVSSICPRCGHDVASGDSIASWGDGASWAHTACLICRACGEWTDSAGVCRGRVVT
jgi:hypothetical protein